MKLDIIKLALDSDFYANQWDSTGPCGYAVTLDELERFAALVLEEAARVCESYDAHIETMRDSEYQAELAGRQAGAMRCAAAIRQLKE